MENTIYKLGKRSIIIDKMGAICLELTSEYDPLNFALPEYVRDTVFNYYKGIPNENINIVTPNGDPEKKVSFSNIDLTKKPLVYTFFNIKCAADTEAVFTVYTRVCKKIWVNNHYFSTQAMVLSIFTVKLKKGDNVFITELLTDNNSEYIGFRINSIENENNFENTSLFKNNIVNNKDKVSLLIDKPYPMYTKTKFRFMLLPHDTVFLNTSQRIKTKIRQNNPEETIDEFYCKFYKEYIIDFSRFDYSIENELNFLFLDFEYKTSQGKKNVITNKVFFYPMFDKIDKAYNCGKSMIESGLMTQRERDWLGAFVEEHKRCDVNSAALFNNAVYLKQRIKLIENEAFEEEIFKPGSKNFFIKSKLDNTYRRYNIYLPKNFDRTKKYPLLILHSMQNYNYDSGIFREAAYGDIICADITARGFTIGSYIGEASFLEILSDIKTKFNIDENRIYATGYSNGAYMTWLQAQAYPHLFAGIYPISSGIYEPFIKNLYNVKVISLSSNLDRFYTIIKRMKRKLNAIKDYNLILAENYIHAWFFTNRFNFKTMENLLSARRDEYPDKIYYRTERNRHRRAYWIEIHSISKSKLYSEIKAEIKENNIFITCMNLTGITIEIPPQINRGEFCVIINKNNIFEYKNSKENQLHFTKNSRGFKEVSLAPQCVNTYKGNGLLEVYLNPLRIVKCSDEIKEMEDTAVSFSEPYTMGSIPKVYVKYPVYCTNNLEENTLLDNSLVLIDNNIEHVISKKIKNNCYIKTDEEGYTYKGKRYEGKYCVMQIINSPWNSSKHILYINCNELSLLKSNFFTRKVVIPSYANGRHEFWNNCALIFDGDNYSYILDYGMDIKTIK